MFDGLSQRFSATLDALRGQGRLTEAQIQSATRDLRMALLEADVALPVVRRFVDTIRERSTGAEVHASLSPGQAFLRIVHAALTEALGQAAVPLNLRAQPPVVIVLCGLQGAGKTTTAGKLAQLLLREGRKSVVLASCDVHRPAAAQQLQRVAQQAGAQCLSLPQGLGAAEVAVAALAQARKVFAEVLILDTAGRTAVDEAMMAEMAAVAAAAGATETLFVVDAMTGQAAAETARLFAQKVTLTGIVLTKADGDARGGAALSVREVTGVPIKYLGSSEKLDGLEAFHPERVAARILGQGDMLSLIEQTVHKVDTEKAQKLVGKLRQNKDFTLDDFRGQLEQMRAMGGMEALMAHLPGGEKMKAQLAKQKPDQGVGRSLAIISSMTRKERRFPGHIKASHRKRIAAGSGTQVQDVNKVLRQFEQARTMMKKMARGGMHKMMRGMAARFPGGGSPKA